MLLGEGWVPVASKYHLAIEANIKNSQGSKYNFYWINTSEAMDGLAAAGKKALTDATRLVNGQS